jgi:hypothetical protein
VDIELSEQQDGSIYFAARDAGVFRFVIPTDVKDPKLGAFNPQKFELDQNYPNPFNLVTIIRYQLSRPMNVELNIIDIRGRTVRRLVNRYQETGSFVAIWDGMNELGHRVSSGLYLYKIQTDDGVDVRKMILAK